MLISIAKNPLIIGIVLGMICLCIRAFQIKQFGRVVFYLNGQLKFLYTSINNLRSMTTSLTLIVLGGQFEFSAAQGRMREIVVGTLWRIVFAPFIGIGIAVLMSIHSPLIYHAAFSVVMEWSGDRSFHIRSIRVYYTMRQSSHQERVYLLPVDPW